MQCFVCHAYSSRVNCVCVHVCACACVCVCVCVPGIMTGALSNTRPWATTWAGELLSLSAWLQIALLSGYALPQVTRAAHSAVTRGLSTSPNDHTATVRYLYTIRPLLPRPHCCHLTLCAAWLRRHAHWAGDSYSSWQLDPSLSPDGTTGFWCEDWDILHFHAAKVRPSNHDCPPWESVCVCERVVTPVSREVPPE